MAEMTDTWHVYPVCDLVEHAVNGGDCPCEPVGEVVTRYDGSTARLVRHNSFDGRELTEEP